MTPIVNLHILAERFTDLSRSAYFDSAFRDFARKTVQAINHVLADPSQYPEDVVRGFEKHVWRVMPFLRGSRTNNAPHETQYVLRCALNDWIQSDVLISSAALEEFNFFLQTEDLWEFIARTLSNFDAGGYKPLFVRIGSPEAFKHRPIFCVPLFHELGHFVDVHFEISKTSLLLDPPPLPPPNVPVQNWQFMHLRHRMEYFADLFFCCYCGSAGKNSLLAIAPNDPDSATHPSSSKRAAVMDDFLSGTANARIDLLQKATLARTGQTLAPKYQNLDLTPAFHDVLTFRLNDEGQLFGIFPAGWDYLHNQLGKRDAPWIDAGVSADGIEKTVNDLVEKSIRNFEIKRKFDDVAGNKN